MNHPSEQSRILSDFLQCHAIYTVLLTVVFSSCSRCWSFYLACGSTWVSELMLIVIFMSSISLNLLVMQCNRLPLLGSWYKAVISHELCVELVMCDLSETSKKGLISFACFIWHSHHRVYSRYNYAVQKFIIFTPMP